MAILNLGTWEITRPLLFSPMKLTWIRSYCRACGLLISIYWFFIGLVRMNVSALFAVTKLFSGFRSQIYQAHSWRRQMENSLGALWVRLSLWMLLRVVGLGEPVRVCEWKWTLPSHYVGAEWFGWVVRIDARCLSCTSIFPFSATSVANLTTMKKIVVCGFRTMVLWTKMHSHMVRGSEPVLIIYKSRRLFGLVVKILTKSTTVQKVLEIYVGPQRSRWGVQGIWCSTRYS